MMVLTSMVCRGMCKHQNAWYLLSIMRCLHWQPDLIGSGNVVCLCNDHMQLRQVAVRLWLPGWLPIHTHLKKTMAETVFLLLQTLTFAYAFELPH